MGLRRQPAGETGRSQLDPMLEVFEDCREIEGFTSIIDELLIEFRRMGSKGRVSMNRMCSGLRQSEVFEHHGARKSGLIAAIGW